MSKDTKHIPTPLPVPKRAPILVVDDDEDIRTSVRLFLEEEDFSPVAVAATMADTLAYLASATCPHVVLLDYRMADANADTLLGCVQQHGAFHRHAYVLMSAMSFDRLSEAAQRLIDAVCTEVVYKPFDVTVLLEAVQRAAAHLAAGSPSPDGSHPLRAD